jgi:hypothetical protein
MAKSATLPVSPAHPEGVGSRKYGGHVTAYLSCPRFDRATKIALGSTNNPWHDYTPAHTMFVSVLLPLTKNGTKETTVGDVIDASAKLKTKFSFTAREVQDHLRWLFTGSYACKLDGKFYPELPANTVAVKRRAPKQAAE